MEVLSSADIFQTRGQGVLQIRTSAFFEAKIFEIYGVSARKGEGGGGGKINFLGFFGGVLF